MSSIRHLKYYTCIRHVCRENENDSLLWCQQQITCSTDDVPVQLNNYIFALCFTEGSFFQKGDVICENIGKCSILIYERSVQDEFK